MKQLTIAEKFHLIRHHGDRLSRTMSGIPCTRKSDVLESAQRILEIAKGIPKSEWGIED